MSAATQMPMSHNPMDPAANNREEERQLYHQWEHQKPQQQYQHHSHNQTETSGEGTVKNEGSSKAQGGDAGTPEKGSNGSNTNNDANNGSHQDTKYGAKGNSATPQKSIQHFHSFNSTTNTNPPRPTSITRGKSDPSATRRLQTIESGISLHDSARDDGGIHSPKSQRANPQYHQHSHQHAHQHGHGHGHQHLHQHRHSHGYSHSHQYNQHAHPAHHAHHAHQRTKSPSSPLPPLHENGVRIGPKTPQLPNIELSDQCDCHASFTSVQSNHTHHSQASNVSHMSHYSADAGKHGFLLYPTESEEENSTAGSIVYKYAPGKEVPPAEYALPATILKVYGVVDCPECNGQGNCSQCGCVGKTVGGEEEEERGEKQMLPNGYSTMMHYRYGSEGTNQSIISFSSGASGEDEGGEGGEDVVGVGSEIKKNQETRDGGGGGDGLPPHDPMAGYHAQPITLDPAVPPPSSSRFYVVPAPGSYNGNNYYHQQSEGAYPPQMQQPQVQRILPYHERKRLMELEEERERQKAFDRMNGKRGQGRGGGRGGAGRGRNGGGERTPLMNNRRSDHYGAHDSDVIQPKSEKPPKPSGWFGHLAAMIRGDNHKRFGSIEDESKLYRDRAQAFLKKTEKERAKMKEKSKMDELNNVMVPVQKQSFGGHSRSKLSSLSNALDSIASCSDDEKTSCVSDEESGSYFDENDEYTRDSQSEHPEPPKVWNGEPTTKKIVTNNKRASSSSERDRIMRRERLLQEEYEFHLHKLKRENEMLAKRFRTFVLISVAVVLVGVLAVAFVVCIRMLLS